MIQFLTSSMKKRFLILILLLTFGALSSCGIYKSVDAREIPPEADKRVQKNIEEGKGIKIGSSLFGDGANTFQFATSNALWRASLEILDFLPLANVDYAGGIIITDWYAESTTAEDSIKITIKFFSNEIRADGLDIIIHKKNCPINSSCLVKKISSNLEDEIKLAILRKATIFQAQDKDKKIKEYRKQNPTQGMDSQKTTR